MKLIIILIAFQTVEQGAEGILFTALSSKIENLGGNFFNNCSVNVIPKAGRNSESQKELWDLSCEMTKLESKEPQSLPAVSENDFDLR